MENLLVPLPPPILILLAGIFGLMAGSFFNVVIYRMPRGESVVWPPSKCQSCGYRIPSYLNIPVFAWIFLGGKCKSCRAPISAQYPLIEALTGLVAAALAGFFVYALPDSDLDFRIGFSYLVLASIPIFVIDFRHFLIPDMLTYPGIVLGLGISFLPGGIGLMQSLIGAAGAGGLLWFIGFAASLVLKKEAMGLGDVKLVAMTGALFGIKTALFGLIFASVLGCLVGVPMLWLRRLNESRHIPFGPYICVGTALAAFFAAPVLAWYLNLVMPR
ncbi:MAG: prepilin peptidase [Fibrobacteres bacterium]|jgi:leader peptidase (prepilin peptidase)/N-methyltransferase|nr:prepilin peptidase [Fibrobacterota bacterium]